MIPFRARNSDRVRSRALRSDSTNPGCNNPTDADGEICSLQSCGSANGAKVRAQDRLLFFATNERDSRRIILPSGAVSKRDPPHLSPLPTNGARRQQCIQRWHFRNIPNSRRIEKCYDFASCKTWQLSTKLLTLLHCLARDFRSRLC